MATNDQSELTAEREILKQNYGQVKEYERSLGKKHAAYLNDVQEARGRGTEARDDLLHSRNMAGKTEKDISGLRKALKEIYFGKIAYKPQETNQTQRFYITNHRCLANHDLRHLNIIHRFAPAAEMYYSQEGRYAVNGTIENVELSLLRYLDVEEDRLKSMRDLLRRDGQPDQMSLAVQEQHCRFIWENKDINLVS